MENKLNDLKPLYIRKKSFAFQKKLKKMLLHWKVNLADQNKQQPQEEACHVPNMTSQYETNLWSTHVNIVWLAEPIRRCVRWRTQVFKIEGFVCKRFLPSPPSPPSLIFWLSFHFSRGQNRKSRSSVFFCSETKRKRLLCRLRFQLVGYDFQKPHFLNGAIQLGKNSTYHFRYSSFMYTFMSTEIKTILNSTHLQIPPFPLRWNYSLLPTTALLFCLITSAALMFFLFIL